MLPSMIQQITAASLPRPAERANTRKLRQENIGYSENRVEFE